MQLSFVAHKRWPWSGQSVSIPWGQNGNKMTEKNKMAPTMFYNFSYLTLNYLIIIFFQASAS